MYDLTIVTPTYNRGKNLINCYNSLKLQNYFNFQWIIIDDGSVDNTKEIVESFITDENKFKIEYYYKVNGGKHTALNFSHKYIQADIVLFLDSDDLLTNDSIKTIINYWTKYKDNENICGLSFLKGHNSKVEFAKRYPNDEYISNIVECRINGNLRGDYCEIIRTDILKQFPFPVFENEKFLAEGYLWINVGLRYNTVYINKIIYICEYLDGGLTKQGRRLRILNPLGGIENSKCYFNKNIITKIRIKNTWLYIAYSFFANKTIRQLFQESNNSILVFFNLPIGYLLYIYWKIRYLSNQNITI